MATGLRGRSVRGRSLRNIEVIKAYSDGDSIMAIADRFGISRQRVNQIARKADLPLRRPSMAETKRMAALSDGAMPCKVRPD